jgi:hypothetical protein
MKEYTPRANSEAQLHVTPLLSCVRCQRHSYVWRCSFPMINQASEHYDVFDVSSRWKWVVRFMFHPLYNWGMGSRYPLDRLRKLCVSGGNRMQFASCSVHSPVSKLTGRPTFRLLSLPATPSLYIKVSRLHDDSICYGGSVCCGS